VGINFKEIIADAIKHGDFSESPYIVIFTRNQDGEVTKKEMLPTSRFNLVNNAFEINVTEVQKI